MTALTRLDELCKGMFHIGTEQASGAEKSGDSGEGFKMKERSANDEMIEGFLDGYDLDAPEPSANRSASYRHGFMCGRIDKSAAWGKRSADELRKMADEAMEADEPRGI